jgi:Protein of unknown function (DUF3300)
MGRDRAKSSGGTNEEAAMMAWFLRVIMIALLWSVPLAAMGQSAQPAIAPTQPLLKSAELDQLLAPIALYPDPLLSEVLIASTYPLEVVQADRWAKSNLKLKGDALAAALAKQTWDDSVKSLVEVPSVLTMMADQLDWTQKLGDAVLAQQPDVMDSIQRLRGRAQANGKLKSSKEQTVTIKTEDQKQYVVIEPSSPTEIYVPYYEPAVVYGDWPYPDNAPYYFPPPYGYVPGAALATGIAFATGVAVRHAFWSNCDWRQRNINVVANRSVDIGNINRGKWDHNADHRHGVKYNNADVRQKFAKTDIQAGKAARQDFRGKEGQQVLGPNRVRSGADDRPHAGDRDRPDTGDRDRPGAGGDRDRPGAGGGDRTGRDRPSGAGDGARRDVGKGGGGPKQSSGPKGASQKVAEKAGPKASQKPSPKATSKPSAAPRDTTFSHVQSGQAARAHAQRGHQSIGGGGGPPPSVAARGGGGGRVGGGGRRSDVTIKHDITLLGRLDNGLGFYRFTYNGSDQAYVGVMAQEVQTVMPEAVVRGRDGYLKVFYDKLGLKFQTYDRWIASGARVPGITRDRQ